jgi:glutamate transport system substrate-binding protein
MHQPATQRRPHRAPARDRAGRGRSRRAARGLLVMAAVAVLGLAAGCSDSSDSPSLPGSGSTGGADAYDKVITGGPVADDATVAASAWAAKVKKQGYLRVGGTDTGPIFSIKDPTTGKLTGFDAGLSQMLAHYILGGTDVQKLTKLTITTVDTRETLLQNNSVDAVFATYTITEPRAQKVDFAGPYYQSGDAIMVKKETSGITSVGDLAGKKVATESNSTAALALKKYAPTAKVLLFQDDASCVAAVQQGRADAYVLDQGILLSDASTNPAVKVVGTPFTQEPYGIGLPKSDPSAKAFVNAFLQKIFNSGDWKKLYQQTIGAVVSGDPPAAPKIGSVPGS